LKRKIYLKYGKKKVLLPISEKNILKVLEVKKLNFPFYSESKLSALLKNPLGCPPLKDLIRRKKAKRVVIIVNDITRPTPYKVILPPLLKELQEGGIKEEDITFLIATGIHRGASFEEMRTIFGQEIFSHYRIINHDCDQSGLKCLGKLSSNNELWVNPLLLDSDFIITTGVIVPHYFAGFSGGRKSILPGICGRKTIEANHARMMYPHSKSGNLVGNLVHQEMQEAADKVRVDFNLNVVTNDHQKIVGIVAGELFTSWNQGVEISKQIYLCPIEQKAEVVITSAGGYPKDINVYQAQKALENAFQAVKRNGTIILLAECPEGYGEETFARWIEEAMTPDDLINRLQKKFILGGHKAFGIARVVKEVEVIFISSLPPHKVRKLFFMPQEDISIALHYIRYKYGDDFKAYILPSGNTVVPFFSSTGEYQPV